MIRNRKLILAGVMFLLLMIPDALFANNNNMYVVYSVIGNVYKINGNSKSILKPRMQVESSTVVMIPKGSAVTLIDRVGGKMFAMAKIGTSDVGSLIQSVTTPKSLSKQYMGYLIKQLFNKDTEKLIHPNAYMQSTATAFRSETKDSLFLESVSNLIKSPADKTIEKMLCDQNTILFTGYNVKFDIISCATDMPISGIVPDNESCYLRISNKSTTPLFCNVVNIDSLSKKSLLLPIDSAVTCANLLIPANGEVDFKSEPFIFSSPKSRETFLLFATEEPVDFSILLSKQFSVSGRWTSFMPLGVYRKIIYTK
jgi:hypothetical protein